MAAAPDTIGFIGDLDDPWVAAIADAIPAGFRVARLSCSGDVPDEPFAPDELPRLIVMHRHRLGALDRARIKRWRERRESAIAPIVVLCLSPFVRYEDAERVLGLIDHLIPEGTAADILPGRIARLFPATEPPSRRDATSFAIEVSGKNDDLCRTLVDACIRLGYRAAAIDDLLGAEFARTRLPAIPSQERLLTIWEVPVLEPEWPEVLTRRALATGPLIGLMGFADRATVSQAKSHGAVACLDIPFEIEDLIDSVERAAGSCSPDHWPVPARIEPPHQLPPRPRRRAASRETSSVARPWRE
jgi:hypothetical protein